MTGLMKSKFMYWINEIDGRFRDIVLLVILLPNKYLLSLLLLFWWSSLQFFHLLLQVKEWFKVHDINNPMNGSLNSYSLSLLVIFHFQVIFNHHFSIFSYQSTDDEADRLGGPLLTAVAKAGQGVSGNPNSFRFQTYAIMITISGNFEKYGFFF